MNFQPIPYRIKTITLSPNWADVVDLSQLPPLVLGMIGHLIGIQFVVRVAPTFTTAPTVFGLQNVVRNLVVNNGSENIFDGSFNTLRLSEILENGQLVTPDPDTNSGSTNSFYFERFLPLGPQMMANPSDFLFPTSALAGASINMTGGAVTEISADTTTYSGSIEVIAWMTGLSREVRVPSLVERGVIPLSGAGQVVVPTARSIMLAAGLQSGSRQTVTALTAGQIGDTSWEVSTGSVIPVSNAAYQSISQYFNRTGPWSALAGEPRAATDDNAKAVNLGTPTALVAADRVIAPLVAVVRDTKITKCMLLAEGNVTAKWSGTLSSGLFHFTRINARESTARDALAGKALQKLGMRPASNNPKTMSKGEFKGARADFFPWAVKVA